MPSIDPSRVVLHVATEWRDQLGGETVPTCNQITKCVCACVASINSMLSERTWTRGGRMRRDVVSRSHRHHFTCSLPTNNCSPGRLHRVSDRLLTCLCWLRHNLVATLERTPPTCTNTDTDTMSEIVLHCQTAVVILIIEDILNL